MKRSIKIILVAGARPNFMKISPLYEELKKRSKFQPLLVHTGQHYDAGLSKVFFDDLKLPRPDIHLGVGSGTHAVQTAKIMVAFEDVCLKEKPDLVIVVGDVNSTIACALVTAKLSIPVAHVEAGLRSFDRTMPEEINRVLTDQISDILFTTCADANENLLREGINKEKIHFVGNTMIDSLNKHLRLAQARRAWEKLGLGNEPYALMTLHRPSNVDNKSTFMGIMRAIAQLSRRVAILFPAHPRTVKQSREFKMMALFDRSIGRTASSDRPKGGVRIVPPLGYIDFLSLMQNAALVLTDSGGIQEETTILGIPCLTLRENTERPITISQGTNVLVGADPAKIVKQASRILSKFKKQRSKREKRTRRKVPKYWDGRAAHRIVTILYKQLT